VAAGLPLALWGGGGTARPPASPVHSTGSAPWRVPDGEAARIAAAGLPALSQEQLAYHIHAHLDIIVDGKSEPAPGETGIDAQAQLISPVPILEVLAFFLEQLFRSGDSEESPFPPRFHPGFTPIFESEGLAIGSAPGSEVVPSKQVTRVRFPSPAPAHIQRRNAYVGRVAHGRAPAFHADHRGSLRLLPDKVGTELAEFEVESLRAAVSS
jgi:hypothetical protein